MALDPTNSRASGNTTAQVTASGKVLPVAVPAGATVDTTTYNNTVSGSGKLTTLVLSTDDVAFALAVLGDAFPGYYFLAQGRDGIYMGDGTIDPFGASGAFIGYDGPGLLKSSRIRVAAAVSGSDAVQLDQVSAVAAITSGAIPTQQLVSGIGSQIYTGRDAEAHTSVTFSPGAATTATCTVALSPDNVTYSTLCVVTFPVGVVFAGSIRDIPVRVPAGWYLKMTVVNATLGLTTNY